MTAEISPKVRRLVLDRATPDGYHVPLCEAQLPGCENVGMELHHRAGRGRDKRLCTAASILLLCRACHGHITQHYLYDAGFSVHRLRGVDPLQVPVSYRGGAAVWLHVDGSTSPVEGAA